MNRDVPILDPHAGGVILGDDGTPEKPLADAIAKAEKLESEQFLLSVNRAQIRDILIRGRRADGRRYRGGRLAAAAKRLAKRRAKNRVAKASRKANR